jgi:ATP-binding cassette subfamily F protein 3
MHERRVGVLSGGERRRLALALVVASGANFLVLDEPTNHLDLESREALEAALDAFPGTVLLVSHDRALLDGVAQRTLAVEEQRINSYEGGWADYARARSERVETAPAEPKPKPEKAAKAAAPKRPSRKLETLEADIEKQQKLVEKIEAKLAANWTDVDTIAAHRRARDELTALYDRWETMVDEVAG